MKKTAPLFILIAGVLWGCLGIFVRILNSHDLYSMQIVFLRALVTAVVMAVFLLFYDRSLLRIRLRDLWCFLGTGICSIVFFNYCYVTSMQLSSLSVAAVLLYTAPAMVSLLSLFLFRESLGPVKIISLIVTFLGCLLVTGVLTESANVTGSGILFGLGSAFGYALYSIFSRFALDRGYHSFTITFYTFAIAAITSAFMVDTPAILTKACGDPSLLLIIFFMMGLMGTVIPYITYTFGLKHMENGKASILASVEPVTASIVSVIVYHETLPVSGWIGVILVIGALIFCNLFDHTSPGETG